MLFGSEKVEYKEIGKQTFEANQEFYHTICSDMVRKDALDAGIIID